MVWSECVRAGRADAALGCGCVSEVAWGGLSECGCVGTGFSQEAGVLQICPSARDGTRSGSLFCGKEQPKRLSKKQQKDAATQLRSFAPQRQRLRVCRWAPRSTHAPAGEAE